ncbi:MAG: hypothetical protein ACK5Q6_03065 [Cyanobacteriota bacterium]
MQALRQEANGARLGWLLLPQERAVEVRRGGLQGMAVSWIWRKSGQCDLMALPTP